VLRILIALKNPSPWLGFEPATFGSSGQHANHYTTKLTVFMLAARKPKSHESVLELVIWNSEMLGIVSRLNEVH
jgi:hypothetical protein